MWLLNSSNIIGVHFFIANVFLQLFLVFCVLLKQKLTPAVSVIYDIFCIFCHLRLMQRKVLHLYLALLVLGCCSWILVEDQKLYLLTYRNHLNRFIYASYYKFLLSTLIFTRTIGLIFSIIIIKFRLVVFVVSSFKFGRCKRRLNYLITKNILSF